MNDSIYLSVMRWVVNQIPTGTLRQPYVNPTYLRPFALLVQTQDDLDHGMHESPPYMDHESHGRT